MTDEVECGEARLVTGPLCMFVSSAPFQAFAYINAVLPNVLARDPLKL